MDGDAFDTSWPPRPVPPQPPLLESRWRLKAPSGRILECGLYRHPFGVQVRVGYPSLSATESKAA